MKNNWKSYKDTGGNKQVDDSLRQQLIHYSQDRMRVDPVYRRATERVIVEQRKAYRKRRNQVLAEAA